MYAVRCLRHSTGTVVDGHDFSHFSWVLFESLPSAVQAKVKAAQGETQPLLQVVEPLSLKDPILQGLDVTNPEVAESVGFAVEHSPAVFLTYTQNDLDICARTLGLDVLIGTVSPEEMVSSIIERILTHAKAADDVEDYLAADDDAASEASRAAGDTASHANDGPFDRMDDKSLREYAVELGLKSHRNAGRAKLIAAITSHLAGEKDDDIDNADAAPEGGESGGE